MGAYLFFILSILLLSCGQNPQSKQVTASKDIAESFGWTTEAHTGRPVLTLHKTAQDKEFLLQASLIDQQIAAMSHGLKSRIVAFRRQGDQLFMLEATQGHTITLDLPQSLILAAFPIVGETEHSIVFDFNAGMSAVFTNRDWTGHDSNGGAYQPGWRYAPLRFGYLAEVKQSRNHLAIRQVAQVPSSNTFHPFEIKYFLSPYQPNPQFEPSGEADFKRAGFFEVAPQLKLDAGVRIRSTKFDVKKPIRFALSSNTPAAYRSAVRDGILYWKGVLPNIEAIDGPQGVTAPDLDYNIIQWVPYDNAGSAYADALMDPRTGEILHAQAFITSAFAFSSRRKARAFLRQLEQPAPMTWGWTSGSLCEFKGHHQMSHVVAQLLSEHVSDATLLRVSQDFVRAVVAHEVGHLLGLRHNFAGSLSAKNYTLHDRDALFKQYLSTDTVPSDVQTSSSEMDYLPLQDSTIHGYQMRTQPGQVYDYDRMALEMLYFNADPSPTEIPPFCTDSSIGSYTDCQPFDAGHSALAFAVWSAKNGLKTFPAQFLERFVTAKDPAPWQKERPVDSLNLSPDSIAGSLLNELVSLATALQAGKLSVNTARRFPFIGPLNEDVVKETQLSTIEDQVAALGGWDKAFPAFKAKDFDALPGAVETLLQAPAYTNWFSLSERQTILKTAQKLSAKLPNAFAKKEIDALVFPTEWKTGGTPVGDALAQLLKKRAEHYLLSVQEDGFLAVTFELPVKKEVAPKQIHAKLPRFYYEQKVRERATALLKASLDPRNADWASVERDALKVAFRKKIEQACGCNLDDLDLKKIVFKDPKVRSAAIRWLLENLKIWKQLSGK